MLYPNPEKISENREFYRVFTIKHEPLTFKQGATNDYTKK